MKRICLGKIAAAHGVKGLVKIRPYCDDPRLLDSLGPLYTSETGEETLRLRLKNPLGKYWLAEIDGIADRTQAEGLRGTELYTERANMPETENENGFYFEDLIGLDVQEEGETIGHVLGTDDFGAGTLIEIQPKTGGESYYLPYHDQYVIDVHLDQNHIEVQNSRDLRFD